MKAKDSSSSPDDVGGCAMSEAGHSVIAVDLESLLSALPIEPGGVRSSRRT
jgi:hypothetical protein